VTALIGTASPSPTPATAVLIPTRRARLFRQGAARVPGVQRRVGLDDVLHDSPVAPPPGGQRTPESADHARRHRARVAKRIPKRRPPADRPAAGRRSPTVTGVRRAPRARARARSESGSTPTTSTSCSAAVREPAEPWPAPSTTWADVTSRPSSDSATGRAAALRAPPTLAADPQAGHGRQQALRDAADGGGVGVQPPRRRDTARSGPMKSSLVAMAQ